MPTYNPKSEWLIEAIESVRNQIYPHWELCIADDASTDTTIHPILKRYTKEDARIKVIFREKNGHISAASNSALELASGEWVALLDHDDCLTEHALFWVVTELNQNPETQLIYSDEDKIDEKNQRFDPYFKCDWNYELCLSQNQITHLGVYRRDLLKQLEGFRLGMEGAQDYDLVLRYIELIDHNQIHHIPRVLYHWRVHTDSTALGGGDAKPYAMLAGQKALDEHFQRTGTDASAELIGHGYKINYKLPNSLPKVSIIIPTRNGFKLTKQCIDSIIKKTTYNNYEIIIIDNGSNDYKILEYFKSLSLHNNIHVIRDDSPFNYSALNNLAVKQAEGDFICLLNNDIEVISPDWLSEMVGIAIQPNTGAVGARLWYPDNTLQHGGIILGIGGWAGHAHKGFNKGHPGYVGRMSLMSNFSAVTGACLLVRKSLFEKLGGLNENDLKIACNDVDFCLRLKKAGYRNVWTPFADLYHHESATRGYEDTPEKKARFAKELEYMQQHWNQELCHDPAYNPNLTLNHEDFSLAWPPRIDIFSDKTPDQSNQISKSIDKTKHLNRIDKALFAIDKYGTGLEIGPSHNPIAPKKQGFNVHILDHASADELKQKYQGHGLNLDNIEEVDFVWHGEHLQELIGKSECYDWIIASHVIEHVPDLISFLQQCETLLKPTGILSLIIPDKRYCFDYFNSLTSTGMLLDAWAGKHKRPSSGKVFDHYSNAAKQNGNIAWGSDSVGADALVHSVIEAKTHWERAQASTDYIDVHCWRFTPTSFSLLLSDLQMLGLINLEIKTGFDTTGCEFYVSLGKGKSTCNENRFLSLENIRKENAHTYTFGH
jgi:GT2 family glycosyltransferase